MGSYTTIEIGLSILLLAILILITYLDHRDKTSRLKELIDSQQNEIDSLKERVEDLENLTGEEG